MWVEFEADAGSSDILFCAEFDTVPRRGETISPFGMPDTYTVTHVHYEVMDSRGSKAGAICTVEKAGE